MRLLLVAQVAVLLAAPVWGAEYLYQPRPLAQGEQPVVSDGVVVREVLIKKGDTLSRISKRFSGRGTYYPQILLFNQIKNPHWIYPGHLLRVPVGVQRATKPVPAVNQVAVHPPAAVVTPVAAPAAIRHKRAEDDGFARAQDAFKRGDCGAAVTLYDRFISEYPHSSHLPEAMLNRSECYLKLSTK